MISQDDAIAMCLYAAIDEYETHSIEIINTKFLVEDKHWLITFKVWEWFKCVWYAWEGDSGKAYCAFLKELSK